MFNISQQRMHILLYLSPSNSLYRWENRGCQREITLTRDKNGEGNRGHERPKPYLCSLQTSSFSDLLSVVVGVRGSCFHCFKVPVTLVCQSPKWNDLSKFLMYVTLRLHLLFWKSRQLPHALFSAVMKAFFFQWRDGWQSLLTEAVHHQAGSHWSTIFSPQWGAQCQRLQTWSTSYICS